MRRSPYVNELRRLKVNNARKNSSGKRAERMEGPGSVLDERRGTDMHKHFSQFWALAAHLAPLWM